MPVDDSPPTSQDGTVTVRYWAAAHAATGVAEERRPAGPVARILEAAVADHPALAQVLRVASVLVDGMAVSDVEGGVLTTTVRAAPGSVLEVLPPFAGG